jgi:hypothetical protein
MSEPLPTQLAELLLLAELEALSLAVLVSALLAVGGLPVEGIVVVEGGV